MQLATVLLLAALGSVTWGERADAKTRVRGIDLLLEAASPREGEPSSGTHRGNAYTYGETASDPSRQYNGRVYDAGTGFHDYGARLYWPEIGRFVSADTYGGNIADPASLNRYAYVKNNPYKYTDPTGHFAFLAIPAICAAGACEAIASAALATAALIGIVAAADVAVHSDATLLPDAAWDRKAPHPKDKTYGPPGETIDWERYNPETDKLEKSKVTYDEFGRQKVRTDYTDHEKKDHTDPHHHETEYGPGKEQGKTVRKPGPAQGHPKTPAPEQKAPEKPSTGG